MHRLPRHRFLVLWLLIGLLGALPAQASEDDEPAQVRWYQIEMIAFSNNRAEAVNEELWPRLEGPPDFAPAVNLLLPEDAENEDLAPSLAQEDQTTSEAPLAFGLLRHGELELLPQAHRIARSPHYNLLLHIGWRQPVVQNLDPPLAVFIDDTLQTPDHPLDRPGAGAIGFKALMSPQALLRQALLEEEMATSATPNLDLDVLSSIPVIEDGPPQSILFGTVSLRWNRFLHLALNLVYRSQREERHLANLELAQLFPLAETTTAQQATAESGTLDKRPTAPPGEPAGQFRLRESRRIRTNTLYYFDHPLFGVLVRVKPLETPTSSAPTTD